MTKPERPITELHFSYLEPRADRSELVKKWLLRSIVAAAFIYIGKGKFDPRSSWVALFGRLGFGQWLRYFTGFLQVGGGLLVLIPRTFILGIAMLAVTMLGAMASWLFFLGNPLAAMIPGAILGGLVVIGGEELFELVSSFRSR